MEDAVDMGELAGEGAAGVFARGVTDAAPAPRDPSRASAFAAVAEWPSRLWRLTQLYFGQSGMILRGRETRGHPCAAITPPPGAELLRLPTPCGRRIAALFGPALSPGGEPLPDASSRPTLLFFYGNGMYLNETVPLFQHLRRIGANVLVPEYLGYGLSDGPASERGCYATADAAYDHLLQRRDVDPALVLAGGVSLGGAVAIDLAARQPSVAGCIALVTFTSIPDVARHLHPDVPIHRLIRMKFDSLAKMARVNCPVLIGHSTADALVPAWMADRLAAAARGPVTRLVIEGANHHAAEMLEVGGDVIFGAARRFIEGLTAARGANACATAGTC
jgi:pimeloyl-ACP methyl ester carboxylesterase